MLPEAMPVIRVLKKIEEMVLLILCYLLKKWFSINTKKRYKNEALFATLSED